MKFFLGLLLAVSLMSCGGIQTQPTCQVEQYGLLVFSNRTDEYKQVFISRVVHDGERYKRVGEWRDREIPPMVEARLRVHPGMWLVVIDYIAGHRHMRVVTTSVCGTTRFDMKSPIMEMVDYEIKNRRFFQNNCDLCECPLFCRWGRYADILMNFVPGFRPNIP